MKWRWKKWLKEKLFRREVEWWYGGDDGELVPGVEVSFEDIMRTQEVDKVMRLCRGEFGYLGFMLIRNRLTLPGEKKSAECYVCGEEGGDEARHLVGECEGRRELMSDEHCRILKEIVISKGFHGF